MFKTKLSRIRTRYSCDREHRAVLKSEYLLQSFILLFPFESVSTKLSETLSPSPSLLSAIMLELLLLINFFCFLRVLRALSMIFVFLSDSKDDFWNMFSIFFSIGFSKSKKDNKATLQSVPTVTFQHHDCLSHSHDVLSFALVNSPVCVAHL